MLVAVSFPGFWRGCAVAERRMVTKSIGVTHGLSARKWGEEVAVTILGLERGPCILLVVTVLKVVVAGFSSAFHCIQHGFLVSQSALHRAVALPA